jgi:alpha-mannosidase
MTRRKVAIVPHTHWDREWYAPYQTFRLRLVDTLDAFLPLLERDPSYTRFLLDGQMAVVDDYLEVRPEAESTIRRLAVSGRLDMGPWYALMDEFLVSGETMVRDLQMGMARAAHFGGAMDVGYLPDMFGHVAQMPQLLRLAGIHHAVVWRGVPRAIRRTAFWWEALDGSRVRAEYLPQGYGNGEGIADDPKALVDRVAEFEAAHGRFLRDGDPILWMNGTDHQAPQPWLGRVVGEANDLQDEYELAITSLAEHLVAAPTDDLPSWRGELRSGARANLLMGVASNRVDVKQAAARAERTLERLAEPLSALFLPPQRWPARLLDLAWRDVVRNAAHDSICACSVDEVCDAVLHRYAEATQIADGLASRTLDAIAESMADEGWVVVNPSARPRPGLVQLDVPGTGPLDGAQVLVEKDAVVADLDLSLDDARPYLENLTSQQLGARTYINYVDVEEVGDGTGSLDVTLRVAPRLLTNLLVGRLMHDVLRRLESSSGARLRFRILREPFRRILVRVPDVAGFGWRMLGDIEAPSSPVAAAGDRGLTNGVVTVDVDPTAGTFSVNGTAGFDRLVDGGDKGDTYNYDPPANDVVVDAPASVEVTVLETGPLRGRIRVVRTYAWPDHEADGTRVGPSREVAVTTTLEVRAGEPAVRVTTSFVNPSRDHRLRAHFPIPGGPADTSHAECAFGVVERALEAEGGPTERALPTFPSRRFVRASDLTVVHEGLLEYELVDGRELALTLLRATGMLSRVDLAYRPLPAGPPIAMEGPQLLGPVEVRYAVCVDPGADPYALVDDVFLPLEMRAAKGGGTRPPEGTELTVAGAEVSAVRQTPGGLELRVFNPTERETTLTVEDRTGWIVDLRGAPVAPFDGATTMRPWEILTLVLRPSAAFGQ